MSSLGFVLLAVSVIMFVAAVASLYATTMTVRQSRVSPWVAVLGGGALLAGVGGLLLLML